MITTEMMMEFLFSRRTPNLPPKGLADILDRLIWCMNDQGAELLQVRRKWLEGDDKDKVRIALAMDEVFPGDRREDMVRLFDKLTSRWPDLQDACQTVLEQWDRQIGGG
jgi:hypothetical protein